jgi:hypothetical protein
LALRWAVEEVAPETFFRGPAISEVRFFVVRRRWYLEKALSSSSFEEEEF